MFQNTLFAAVERSVWEAYSSPCILSKISEMYPQFDTYMSIELHKSLDLRYVYTYWSLKNSKMLLHQELKERLA